MRNAKLLVLALLLAAVIAAACGTGGPSSDVDTDSDLHRVFGLMPDIERTRQYMRVVNIPRMAELLEVPLPAGNAPNEEMERWVGDLARSHHNDYPVRGAYFPWMTDAEWLSGLNRTRPVEAMANTMQGLGFDTRDIDVATVTGHLVPRNAPSIELVLGGISRSDAIAALQACDECPEHETVEYGGASYSTWGDDFESSLQLRLAPPTFDDRGRAGHLNVADGHAFRTMRTADMESIISVGSGDQAGLLDNADWQSAADVLSQYELALATASEENVDQEDNPWLMEFEQVPRDKLPEGTIEWIDSYPERAETIRDASPRLPGHQLAVTGLKGGEQGYQVVMALVYEDEATAESAADALRQRAESGLRDARQGGIAEWSQYVDQSEFTTEGNVVVGRITPATDGDGRSHYPLFLVLPVPSAAFLGGQQPPVGPTAEFLLH